jgi:hypothetical protein
MLSDAHVAKILLHLAERGRTQMTPGTLSAEFGAQAGSYVHGRGMVLHFLESSNSCATASVTGNMAVRQRMAELAEDEQFRVGDPVNYVKDGKVYKGIVRSVGEGGKKCKLDFGSEKPSGHSDDSEYDDSDLGKDEEK